MIRRLESKDCAAIRQHGAVLAASYYPELIMDIDKAHQIVHDFVGDDGHYAFVCGKPGEPTAALLARRSAGMWCTKPSAAVLLWYSKVPGQGLTLLRHFRDWVREDGRIVMAGWCEDYNIRVHEAYRIQEIASSVGFIRRGGAFLYFPRGAKA